MIRRNLFDPIKHLREKGVTVRLGLPQGGKSELELEFERGRYWTPPLVLAMHKLVQQSEKLIRMQLNVEKGIPPRPVAYLLARGLIATEERNGQWRYVITEAGKRWMGWR